MKFLQNRALWFCIVLVGGSSISAPTFAAGSCKISSGPTPEISNYITKLNASVNKLRDASASSTCNVTGANTPTTSANLSEAAASITRGVNISLTQDSYADAAAFTTELSLKSEVPPALRQHLNLLLKNQDSINSAIEQIYRSCAQNQSVPAESIVEGMGSESMTLSRIGELLLTNHIDVISIYRTSVLGRPASKDGLLLVPADFGAKVYSAYGPDAQQDCRKEGDVFKKIKEALANLARTSKSISTGMSVWQTSDLKTESTHEAATRKKREEVYAPKLEKTGLLSDVSNSTVRNQTSYDTPDKESGISGFLGNIGQKAVTTFEKIKTFYTFVPKVEEAKTTDDWVDRYKNIQELQTDVGQEVLVKYLGLMSQIGDAQLTKDTYEGKLGRIYIELQTGIDQIAPMRKVAQKICSQDQTSNVDAAGCEPVK